MNPESIQILADRIEIFFPAAAREEALMVLANLQEELEEKEALVNQLDYDLRVQCK